MTVAINSDKAYHLRNLYGNSDIYAIKSVTLSMVFTQVFCWFDWNRATPARADHLGREAALLHRWRRRLKLHVYALITGHQFNVVHQRRIGNQNSLDELAFFRMHHGDWWMFRSCRPKKTSLDITQWRRTWTGWRHRCWVCTLSSRLVTSARVTSNSNAPPLWQPSIGGVMKPARNQIVLTISDPPHRPFISTITAPWLLLLLAPLDY